MWEEHAGLALLAELASESKRAGQAGHVPLAGPTALRRTLTVGMASCIIGSQTPVIIWN
jgi:hypothetical protein